MQASRGTTAKDGGLDAARWLGWWYNLTGEESLKQVFDQISRDVPVGRAQHQDDRALADAARPFDAKLTQMTERHPQLLQALGRFSNWVNQMGTLGRGQPLHRGLPGRGGPGLGDAALGQPGIGNAIGHYFIDLARRDMERWFIQVPDRDLAYFPEGSPHFDDYVAAVSWAQAYARENRDQMMTLVLAALARHLPPFTVTTAVVNCHHNYVDREHHFGENVWVTRKGAIRPREEELGIIPGSIGARSYIVRGLGNPDSFCSCAHGAGRRMSRTAAERQFTQTDLIAESEGVICRKDKGVIDEIPGAYKGIDQVMANQADLVEVVHTVKQVVCVKG